ncbi:MAG: sulfur carrier protein ThiS [Bacteroidota bacterium]
MKIILNNREETFEKQEMTVNALLSEKNFTFKMLVIKVNDVLVKKEDYEKIVIRDNDRVSVLHLISGG